MTFDQDGRLYVADYGTGFVAVFDSAGRLLRRYSTGLRHPSNVAFGGRDFGELYVTGAPIDENGAGQLVVLSLGVRRRAWPRQLLWRSDEKCAECATGNIGNRVNREHR